MRQSEHVLYITLVDFLLQLLFLGLVLSVIHSALQPDPDEVQANNAFVAEIKKLTGISDLTVLTDELTRLGPLKSAANDVKFARELESLMTKVSDGDTITVLDKAKTQHKIRLVGIDAPEKKQPFGQASKHSLSDMVFGKDVRVEWTKKDRYQRTLGKVLVEGKDVCLEQVKRGMAWHYKKYQRDQTLEDQKLYSDAEVQARTSKFGLWVESNPIEPSVFRHKK